MEREKESRKGRGREDGERERKKERKGEGRWGERKKEGKEGGGKMGREAVFHQSNKQSMSHSRAPDKKG